MLGLNLIRRVYSISLNVAGCEMGFSESNWVFLSLSESLWVGLSLSARSGGT